MNDGNQNMVRVWEQLFFDERITATKNIHNPDYYNLARSYGINSIRCDHATNLEDSIKYFLDYKGPILLECKVESDKCFPLNPPGKALDNMILEDLKINMGTEIPN